MLSHVFRCSRNVVRFQIPPKSCRLDDRHIRSLSSTRTSEEPLRILFCGSDDFSIICLEELCRFQRSSLSNIASIDVATKTDKRTGRGLKVITPPPIKSVAERLGLPLHQFDTFRGWNLPTREASVKGFINMVVAVSFGLLVPPRILGACCYGGLNVHPSMLPDLKGSAPIEHAIINGYTQTGVTVQTLHPSKFDEGQVVLQTPPPGLPIPNHDRITAPQLRNMLAPIGAEMLVRVLQERLYLPSALSTKTYENDAALNYAPKSTPESRHVDLKSMSALHILRLNRALGKLWLKPLIPRGTKGFASDTRIILGDNLRLATSDDLPKLSTQLLAQIEVGKPFCVTKTTDAASQPTLTLFAKTANGTYLCIPEMAISGLKSGPSAALAAKAMLFDEPMSLREGNLQVRIFRHSPE